eukprot:934387_1
MNVVGMTTSLEHIYDTPQSQHSNECYLPPIVQSQDTVAIYIQNHSSFRSFCLELLLICALAYDYGFLSTTICVTVTSSCFAMLAPYNCSRASTPYNCSRDCYCIRHPGNEIVQGNCRWRIFNGCF